MKAKMLKIAGVKSEAAFYKKFPNQEAFMKVHGKEFKKAQAGTPFGGAFQSVDMAGMQTPFPKPQVPQEPDFEQFTHLQNPGFGKKQQKASNAYRQQELTDITGDMSNPLGENPLSSSMDIGGNIMGNFTGIKDAFDAHKANTKLSEKMETWANVSDVHKRAGISNAFAEKPKNQWFSPDDPRFIHNASELYNTQGGPTDVITQNGGVLQGGGEIQNTFAPGTLYDDLGYEPFNESNDDDVKAYQGGGGFGNWLGQANSSLGGGTSFASNIGVGSPFDSMIGGGTRGGDLGGKIGAFGGPATAMLGSMVGRWLDKNPGRQKNAQNKMNSNNAFLSRLDTTRDIHNQFSQVTQNGGDLELYEEGGWVSNDWQPQVIASFGGVDEQEVYDYAHEGMDTLRAGGHMRDYTPVSDQGMKTYAMGGKLKTHGVGEIETISYNPYMPGSGEMGMLRGPQHKDGGMDISYGNAQNGYDIAQNGNNAPQVNAEGGEPIIEMQEGGNIDPQTGEPALSAVVLGNIPASLTAAKATGDETLINLFTKYDGKSIKSIGNSLAKDNVKTGKYKAVASNKGNKSDNTPTGMLNDATAKVIKDAADKRYEINAQEQMKLANWQSAVNDHKDERSAALGRNVSAEDMGKGLEKYDYDPITKDSPLNRSAKFGANLNIAQTGITTAEEPSITEEQYNNFVKLYEEGKNTKSKKSPSIKNFQHLYHQSFPKEAIAAIQKTTKENGLSNKAKSMGLTAEDIASGKDVNKILESNEDEFFGPRTEQYMAKINSRFKQTPGLQLTPLGKTTTPTKTATDRKQIDVVPLKENKLGQFADMLRQFQPQAKLPEIDPRQFAGEYMAMAQNQYEPVPMQRMRTQLDPMTRMSYQDIRNENTADFRDAERQLGYNPAAMAGLLGKKYLANQQGYGEEFRTNQALEDRIYGGNRAKVNQEMATNLKLDADQAAKQALALSKTKETQQKAIASIADKYLQHDARNLEYNVKSNLFPTYGYDPSGRIRTQGPGFRPTIPQMYGGKGTIQEIPVYKADGTIDHYKMQDDDTNTEQGVARNGGSINNKRKGSVVKNAKNGSIVKLQKNL